MRRILIKVVALAILISATHKTFSQVTIGSSKPPVPGALLDLKQDDATLTNGTTAKRGLGMPRVKLTDKYNLYPMFEKVPGNNTPNTSYDTATKKTIEDNAHIGLMVYHTDRCTLQGKGLYVWIGTEWNKLGESDLDKFKLSDTYFDIPSGSDGRGTITAQTIGVTWAGASKAPVWTKSNSTSLLPIVFVDESKTGTVGASPATVDFTPKSLTIDAINPWQSKESKIIFTDPECGSTQDVILNQTHYALKVNNQFGNSQIVYTAAGGGNFAVQGNAEWATSISDPNNILTTRPAASGGATLKDGTNQSTTVSYAMGSGSKYHTADITFKDKEMPRRFNDLTVSIFNCDVGSEPSLDVWAERLNYSVTEIAAVKAATAAQPLGVSSAVKNGYQLHRDQDGNLFISSDFGAGGRWMIVNLQAKTYVPNSVGRTGDDAQVNIAMPTTASGAGNFASPLWAYPKAEGAITVGEAQSAEFTANRRLGLLYNWAAATNGKGRYTLNGTQLNTTGKDNINDGEVAGTYPNDPQTAKIQGICPNGWHLPSDTEWTILEKELNTNTSKYAGIADANGTITVNQKDAWRGSTHGQGMKDTCPTLGGTLSNGASNVMSPAVNGGFSGLLAGYATDGRAGGYGTFTYFWSASGSETELVWARSLKSTSAQTLRKEYYRHNLFLVRCKKDN